ncbi:unnamed protein product [Brachionus calyciflorus]|uniref:FLYWCH-type domain-containing protein n=1 Tax=Brachionus calyciflorus TaxID=104777 RepID=A0A813MZ94_9BILA|nr:unnamed protein product [Brachionus calyciflorus]
MENFKYIKSNTWKEEYQNEEKNKNEKKGLQVLRDGHLYYKHRINKRSIYWKCKAIRNVKQNDAHALMKIKKIVSS